MLLSGRALFIASLSVLLQACTVGHHRIRPGKDVPGRATSKCPEPCSISYSIEVEYRMRLSHSRPPFGGDAPERIRQKYIEATDMALKEAGYRFERVNRREDADFIAEVLEAPFVSALPQEWLTGMSLGLIPSWGTRYGELAFRLTNRQTGRSITRYVDWWSFNHLIVFPVFWLTILNADSDVELYRDELIQFVKEEWTP